MSLDIRVRHDFGAFALDVAATAGPGVTALFGRSGAGKTTLVNALAGLLKAREARIAVDGHVLADTARGIHVPTHRRRIGYVFQEDRLFPHLSVAQNLAYGARFAPRRERWARRDEIVGLLGIAPLLGRGTAALSGGERQRVAIGRALMTSPRLLLMDEPLAALDQARKAEILPYIARLRDTMRVPIVYVSHAIAEVAQLADTIIVLSEGRVAAAGPVAEVLSRLDLFPATGRFEAGSVLTARVVAHDPEGALTRLAHPGGTLSIPLAEAAVGAELRLRVRARDVALAVGALDGLSIRNRLSGVVGEIRAGPAPYVEVRIDLGPDALIARITGEAARDLALAPGKPAVALVKSVAFDRPLAALDGS